MCSIFGVAGDEDAAYLTYLGLHSLQHRGQEGAGIVSTDGDGYYVHRRRGLVSDVFQNGSMGSLKGRAALGHTRYSTSGGDTDSNIQPLVMKSAMGWISMSHNGNLSNSADLTSYLEQKGSIFQTTTDTEVIMHLLARCKDMDLPHALICALEQVEGAYSLLVMNKDYMIAIRDPHGFRPLHYGQKNGSTLFASETCAFDLVGGESIREIRPGEMVIVDVKNNTISSVQVFEEKKASKCVFELIYFSRPDSNTFGKSVYGTRKALGRRLAQEQPAEADLVIPVPDSGIAAAIGYAEELAIPFEMGIIRSHYVGRTFIQPKQSMRDVGVRLKLSAIQSIIKGKNLVVVDDSLVRGTTSKKIIQMLRDAGAARVHLRVSAPPTISPCFYGIDTPNREELIASNLSIDEISDFIGADSLGYLSPNGLKRVCGEGFCSACFTGDYPTLVPLGRISKSKVVD